MADDERADQAPTITSDRSLGPYRLVRHIGEGGMGAVWEARHQDTNARVAVKVLRDEYADDADTRERFLREGRAAAQVRHPNAVELLDAGSDGGVAYLAFEFLEGETLAQRLGREGALPHATICEVMLPALAAVAAAHRAGVVHRDLKPANLFLVRGDGEERTKVLDFGISKLSRHAGLATLTETGATLGTPAYMSPEQLRSARDTTPLSDVFSLGVVLYECATGRRPFAGETSVALFEAILADRYAPAAAYAPALPPRFDAAVRRALRSHPEERFALVDALARELLAEAPASLRARWEHDFAVEGGAPSSDAMVVAPATVPATTISRRRVRPPDRTIMLAVVALAVASFGVWVQRPPARGSAAPPLVVAPAEPEPEPVGRPEPAPAPTPAAVVVATQVPASAPRMRHAASSTHAPRTPEVPAAASPPAASPAVVAPPVVAPPVVVAVPAEDAGARASRLPVGTNLMPF